MKDTLVLIEEIRAVKGYLRGVLYDLPRREFKFVSNQLIEFINDKNKTSIKSFNEQEMEFVDFLIKNEFAFLTNANLANCFSELDLQWDYPAVISNVVLEFSNIDSNISNVLSKISITGVTVARIEIISSTTEEEFDFLCEMLNDSELRCISIMLHDGVISDDYIPKTKKIESIIFLNNHINAESEILTDSNFYIIRSSLNRDEFLNKQRKHPYSFSVNISLFTESLEFNNFYNRKLFIDSEGNILNAKKSFGNIYNLNSAELLEIIESDSFKYYWSSKKDHTDVCKDCEFRYMCVDYSIPVKRQENQWFKLDKCEYNPYIAKWKDDDEFQSLADCGVVSNEKTFSIDHERVKAINTELWDE